MSLKGIILSDLDEPDQDEIKIEFVDTDENELFITIRNPIHNAQDYKMVRVKAKDIVDFLKIRQFSNLVKDIE